MKINKMSCNRFGFRSSRVFGLGFLAFIFLIGLFFYSGCGVVHVLSTPTRHERKVEAEYFLNRAEW